jgi:hypothetical protein
MFANLRHSLKDKSCTFNPLHPVVPRFFAGLDREEAHGPFQLGGRRYALIEASADSAFTTFTRMP